MKLRNTNPLGDVWVGDLGRDVAAGEVVDVPAEVAGSEPSGFEPVETPDKPWLARVRPDGTWEQYDPGSGLLAQAGNWERVAEPKSKSKSAAPPVDD